MRLLGLLLIFVGIVLGSAGLADVAHVGMNPVMAATGLAVLVAGAVLVALGSKKKEFAGFEVKPLKNCVLKGDEQECD